ncbi:hypothetical protein ACLB2K_013272 [Fragaria x ananassa]
MALKTTSISLCSVPALFFAFTLLCTLSLSLFFLSNPPPPSPSPSSSISHLHSIKVYVADLPRSLNYGLLHTYWASGPDSRLPTDADHQTPTTPLPRSLEFPPYPENPLIKQYSAEYWILGDLMTPPHQRTGSFARRVFNAQDADVVFVPFFATLSAELQLATAKGMKTMSGRCRWWIWSRTLRLGRGQVEETMSLCSLVVLKLEAFLADPVAMWHVRAELAPAVLLVVDFGGWYRLESKLQLSENKKRMTLLYFKGAKHRHRGGLVREKLWDLLANMPNVIMEEGFPNATGREQSIKGMRTSEFCLHPAGDTPTSCRLFDAIQSLCIPVIISDNIELPFEGMIDYLEFSVFIAVSDALRPNWLVSHLKSISKAERDKFRQKMAQLQPVFQYDNGHPGGIGPISPDGAVNHIWRKETAERAMKKPISQRLDSVEERKVVKERTVAGAPRQENIETCNATQS